jgi:lysophospholipase L1-like esterase
MKSFTIIFSLALVGAVLARGQSEDVLSRTAHKLAVDHRLCIGYFGGSITDGTGASAREKTSWRALTTEWFQKRFPRADVTAVNACIGGTGSDLGVYRVGRDLLARKPDMVFVEFSVNDSGRRATGTPDPLTPAMEGIVRQIWSANPNADVVFVYTTMKNYESFLEKGGLSPAAIRHQSVANHYGISSIDVGRFLWTRMRAEGKSWGDYFIDGVHPNDRGHALYAEAVRDFLEARDWTRQSTQTVVLPAPLSVNSPVHTRMVDAFDHAGPGWMKVEKFNGSLCPHYIQSDQPGAQLVFPFQGNAIGLVWIMSGEGGDIEWSVDGSAYRRASSRRQGGATNPLARHVMFADPLWGTGLEPGNHELRLRGVDGGPVSIGSFIVNEAPVER